MIHRSRNLALLTLSQALGMAGISAVVLTGGIVGSRLAPSPSLATLPISIMVIGTALSTIPAAHLMRKIGRRRGFQIGTLAASLAALLAAYAISQESFLLFCLAILVIGANAAFVQQYRFAAAESVAPEQAGRAISFVLLGGILAGFLGPEVARRTKDWLEAGEFAGSFTSLAWMYALVLVLMLFLKELTLPAVEEPRSERPLGAIAAQPVYRVAVLSGMVAYGVMTFVMTASPVYMTGMHGFHLDQTALVIQSHIIAMFLPSLFSGVLVERLGPTRVMLAGLACFFTCAMAAVISHELVHFWGVLVLLGIGWNFLFVGATVLLTGAYHPEERFKAQAANDFAILGVQSLASLSAGTVLYYASWNFLNLLTLPLLVFNAIAVLRLRRRLFTAPARDDQPVNVDLRTNLNR